MKTVTSKQTGMGLLSPGQTMAVMIAVFGWASCVLIMWAIGFPWWIMMFVLCALGALLGGAACIFIFDNARFKRTVIWGKYFVRELRGKTTTHHLTIDSKAVKKRVPIKQLHCDDGLIEYLTPKNQFGVMFRYDPAENRKEGVDKATARIEKIVHTFSQDLWVSFHFSHIKDTSTAIEDNLLAAMNQPSATISQKEHLFGIYEHITSQAEKHTTRAFLMSVRLGEFKNVAMARSAYRSSIPGMLKLFHEAGIFTKLLISEDEVVRELAQFAVLEEL